MSWRVARAIQQLFDELNEAAPKRSKRSDGTIGDAAHASRTSDHNPWVRDDLGRGVVTAGDYTDDDANGADMSKVVDYLTKVSRDKRIKYLIHNRKIYSSYPTSSYPAWAARPYSGPNAHTQHLHVSVNPEPRHYDSAAEWGIAAALKGETVKPGEKPAPKPEATKKAPKFPLDRDQYFGPRLPLSNEDSVSGYYRHAKDLEDWQRQMKARGWAIRITGLYDAQTEKVARDFQREKGLRPVDGLIGPDTWRAAWEAPITK